MTVIKVCNKIIRCFNSVNRISIQTYQIIFDKIVFVIVVADSISWLHAGTPSSNTTQELIKFSVDTALLRIEIVSFIIVQSIFTAINEYINIQVKILKIKTFQYCTGCQKTAKIMSIENLNKKYSLQFFSRRYNFKIKYWFQISTSCNNFFFNFDILGQFFNFTLKLNLNFFF